MKKPKQPFKPKQPTKPNEYSPPTEEHISIYDGSSLADVLSAIGTTDPAKVCFSSTRGYYDDYDYQFEWVSAELKRNPNYDEQMQKYQVALIEYHKNIEIYNSNLKEFNSLHKQYMKWFHENELKKLE